MSPQRDGRTWVTSVTEHVQRQFRLDANLEQSKHIKVTFTDGALRFLWVVSSTPSDVRSKRNALSTLRKGLRQVFGIESIRSLSEFPLQMVVTTELVEEELEEEWDAFFEILLHPSEGKH